jgi:two-component sensor histidine kinase
MELNPWNIRDSHMDIEVAINLVDKLFVQAKNEHLNSIQINLLRGVWLHQSYEEIAASCYCSISTIKMIGARLWTDLSKSLGEKVTKKTVRTILESYAQDLKAGKLRSQRIKPAQPHQSPKKNHQENPIQTQTKYDSWFNYALLLPLTEKLDSSVEKALIHGNAGLSEIQSLSKKLQLLHHLSSPQYSLTCRHLDMMPICRNVIKNLTAKFRNRQIIFSLFEEPVLPHYDLSINTWADPKLVYHSLENILINALQYSDPESAITLDLNIEEQKGIFTVIDEGIGIPSDELEQIFQPFYCATNARQRSGHGLGLTIVEKSVRLHDGELFVSSQIKQGSTFTVVFPVA